MTEILRGIKYQWELVNLLGEGDAGEAWLARKVGDAEALYVVKRPSRRVYGGSVERQARQIRQEGQVLEALKEVKVEIAGATVRPVRLLDRADNGGGDEFIVIEKARGFDLKYLRALYQKQAEIPLLRDREQRYFLRMFRRLDSFPMLLVYRSVAGVARLLEHIHSLTMEVEGKVYYGVIWNDVKAEHLFWDPIERQLTIIDWGNAQLLGEDGVSVDRRFSRQDDYGQFCKVMGRYAHSVGMEKGWFDVTCKGFDAQSLRRVVEKVTIQAEIAHQALQGLRYQEKVKVEASGEEGLEDVYQKIVAYGEAPNYHLVREYWEKQQKEALERMDIEQYRQACKRLGNDVEPVLEALMALYAYTTNIEGREKVKRLTGWAHRVLREEKRGIEAWAEIFWKLDDLAQVLGEENEYLRKAMESVRLAAGVSAKRPLESVLEHIKDEEKAKMWHRWREALIYGEDEKKFALENEALQRAIGLGERVVDLWNYMPEWQQRKIEIEIEIENVYALLKTWLLYDPDRRRLKTFAKEVEAAFAWLKVFEKGPDKLKPRVLRSFAEKEIEAYSSTWPKADWLEVRIQFLERLKKKKGKNLAALAERAEYQHLATTVEWIGRALTVDKNVLEAFYDFLDRGLFVRAKQHAEEYLAIYPAYAALADAFEQCEAQLRGTIWSERRSAENNGVAVKEDRRFGRYQKLCESIQRWWYGIRENRVPEAEFLRHYNDIAWAREVRDNVNKTEKYYERVHQLFEQWRSVEDVCRTQLERRCVEIGQRAKELDQESEMIYRGYYQRAYGRDVGDEVQQLRNIRRSIPLSPARTGQDVRRYPQGADERRPSHSRGSTGWRIGMAALGVVGVIGVVAFVSIAVIANLLKTTSIPPKATFAVPTVPPLDSNGSGQGQSKENGGAEGGVMPGTASVALIPTNTPTPTMTATLTPSPTPTFTPTPNWCLLGAQVLQQGKYPYESWRQVCGWKPTYEQASLDMALWQWLQNPSGEGRAKDLVLEKFPEARPYVPAEMESRQFARWVRTTLAMCHAPAVMTKTQRAVWDEYRARHFAQFEHAEDLVRVLCGEAEEGLPKKVNGQSQSLIPLFEARAVHTSNVFRSGQSVRWVLDNEHPAPLLPKEEQGRMPRWEDVASLEMGFCLAPSKADQTEQEQHLQPKPPLVLWLQRGNVQFGLEMDWIGLSYAVGNLQLRLGAQRSPALQPENLQPENLQCDDYSAKAILKPVMIGRMVFWTMHIGDKDWIADAPLVWPVFGGENSGLNFWWAAEPRQSGQQVPRVQVVITRLDYEKITP